MESSPTRPHPKKGFPKNFLPVQIHPILLQSPCSTLSPALCCGRAYKEPDGQLVRWPADDAVEGGAFDAAKRQQPPTPEGSTGTEKA